MKIARNILSFSLLAIIIFICAVVLLDSWIHPNEIPSFFGWKPFIMTNDKIDNIKKGDIVFVKEFDSLKLNENDIIAYKNQSNYVTIGKIILIDDELITIKPNTLKNEYYYITHDQVEGKYKFSIALIGLVALELQKPLIAGICLLFPVVVIVLLSLIDNRKTKKKKKVNKQKEKEETSELKQEENKKKGD